MEPVVETRRVDFVKVIGIGRAGTHILRELAKTDIPPSVFVAVDCDERDLRESGFENQIAIYPSSKRGFNDFALSVEDVRRREHLFQETVRGCRGVFLVGGRGGLAGTTMIPTLCEMLEEQGIFTVVIVTVPFSFEGHRRRRRAEAALLRLKERAHVLIPLSGDSFLGTIGRKSTVRDAFRLLDKRISGVAERLISERACPGAIEDPEGISWGRL